MMNSSSSNDAPAPIAKDRDIEEDKAMLGDLLGTYRNQITAWERNFCESCLNRILKYKVDLSVKQAAVLDKTWTKYTASKEENITPSRNRVARDAKDNSTSTNISKHFDSYDDDIPF